MKKIYKYKLGVDGEAITLTDRFSHVLCVQEQDGMPHVWIEITDAAPVVTMTIASIGTGWEMPDHNWIYIGTAQDANGFVWHYYYMYAIKPEEEIPVEEVKEEENGDNSSSN